MDKQFISKISFNKTNAEVFSRDFRGFQVGGEGVTIKGNDRSRQRAIHEKHRKDNAVKKQFFLYLVLGGLLTLCEWIGFYALVYIAKVHYLLSSAVMFVVISALGLVVYKRAIFGASHLSTKAEVSVIYAINIAGLAVNSFILWFLVEFVGLGSLLGKIIASFLTAFYSFFARKIWVYKADDKIQSAEYRNSLDNITLKRGIKQ